MIFPDVSLKEWLTKYDELEIEKGACNNCGKEMPTIKPFIEKDYVGLVSKNCLCDKNTNQAMTLIPISKKEIDYWNEFLNY